MTTLAPHWARHSRRFSDLECEWINDHKPLPKPHGHQFTQQRIDNAALTQQLQGLNTTAAILLPLRHINTSDAYGSSGLLRQYSSHNTATSRSGLDARLVLLLHFGIWWMRGSRQHLVSKKGKGDNFSWTKIGFGKASNKSGDSSIVYYHTSNLEGLECDDTPSERLLWSEWIWT